MGSGERQMATIVMVLLSVVVAAGEFGSCNGREIVFVLLHDMPAVGKYPTGVHQFARLQNYGAKLTRKHDSLLASQFSRGSYQKLYSYTHVVNGFAAVLESDQIKALEAHPDVRHIQKSTIAQVSTTHSPMFLGLPTHVWPKFGGPQNAGEGIVIGVIDSGIDPTHPSFRNDPEKPYSMSLPHFHGQCDKGPLFPRGSCTGKIIAARSFNKAIKAVGDFNATIDLESPFDTDGHGSHTASIAAGNEGVEVIFNGASLGNASGMAPRARIAAYRCVYTNTSNGNEADVVAAIDQAVKDGVDIISMSLNFDPDENGTTFLTVIEVAMLFATKAGVFVAQSAGNSGPRPHSMRSNSPWVSTVAASTTDRRYRQGLVLGNKVTVSEHTISPATAQDQMYSIVAAASARLKGNTSSSTEEFDCQVAENYDRSALQNKILLCVFSRSVAVTIRALEAVERTINRLGAVGLVLDIKNANDERRSLYIFGTPALVIRDNGSLREFYNYFNSTRNPVGRFFGSLEGDILAEAPLVTAFSARGPSFAKLKTHSPINLLKPNFLAPGSSIWGAYSAASAKLSDFQGERFAMLSGTSMATSHVAGVAALLKQMHPSWGPATIASALSTSADIRDNKNKVIRNNHFQKSTPYDFGSGLINAPKALDPGLVFDAGFDDYINFVCSIEDVSKEEVQKAIGLDCTTRNQTSTLDLNTPSIIITKLKKDGVTIVRRVTNVASDTETYGFQIFTGLFGLGVKPVPLTIKPNQSVDITFHIVPDTTINSSQNAPNFSFGSIIFRGDRGHFVSIPVIVFLLSYT